MLYIVFCAILLSNVSHISHISLIGQRFQYECIWHKIRHYIAMVRFADDDCYSGARQHAQSSARASASSSRLSI